MTQNAITLLLSAFAIFPIWIIEQFLPYPWLIEELAKLYLVSQLTTKGSKTLFLLTSASGIIFSLSEDVLYLSQGLAAGNVANFHFRIGLTLPMHLLTFYLLTYSQRNRSLAIKLLGLTTAIFIHYTFNQIITIKL